MGKYKNLEEWREELVGKQFGRLTVQNIEQHIRKSTGKKDGFEAVCKCTCGNTTTVILSNLLSGNTTSCNCVVIENSRINLIKMHQWQKEHPEEFKKIQEDSVRAMLLWQKEHPEESKKQKEKVIEKALKWKKENPDKAKVIDELRLEKAHVWQKEHTEEFKDICRKNIKHAHKWQKEHPEKLKEFQERAMKKAQEWRKEHPEKVSEYSVKANMIASNHYSKEEEEIYNYLLSIGYSIERQFLVENYLFDFHINNFLIEYHGSTYHYSKYENLSNHESKEPPANKKDKNYHKTLRDIAIKNNYHLIQIWDYLWFNNKPFVQKLIKDQLSGIAAYKDYLENNLLNNDYGFVIDGEQVEPNGFWVSTYNKKLVTENYSKAKVLVFNSGYTKIKI